MKRVIIWITNFHFFAIQMPGNNLLFKPWPEYRTIFSVHWIWSTDPALMHWPLCSTLPQGQPLSLSPFILLRNLWTTSPVSLSKTNSVFLLQVSCQFLHPGLLLSWDLLTCMHILLVLIRYYIVQLLMFSGDLKSGQNKVGLQMVRILIGICFVCVFDESSWKVLNLFPW